MARRPSWEILKMLKGTVRVNGRYRKIPGLRAHTRAHNFNLRGIGGLGFGFRAVGFGLLRN